MVDGYFGRFFIVLILFIVYFLVIFFVFDKFIFLGECLIFIFFVRKWIVSKVGIENSDFFFIIFVND